MEAEDRGDTPPRSRAHVPLPAGLTPLAQTLPHVPAANAHLSCEPCRVPLGTASPEPALPKPPLPRQPGASVPSHPPHACGLPVCRGAGEPLPSSTGRGSRPGSLSCFPFPCWPHSCSHRGRPSRHTLPRARSILQPTPRRVARRGSRCLERSKDERENLRVK